MKDVINTIIEDYGTRDIHYSIILYGPDASTKVRFKEGDLIGSDYLKRFVSSMPLTDPPSKPSAALQEAKKAFEAPGARRDAVKVLVVMADTKGESTVDEILSAAKPLMKAEVKVLAVAVGPDTDTNELEKVTGNKKNVVVVPVDEDAQSVAEKVMKIVFESGTSSESHWSFL